MPKERNIQIDMFKGFAIIAIVLWHAYLIPTWSFIWGIPTFVFATAALYNKSIETLTLKKILTNMIWVFGLIAIITTVLYFLGFEQIGEWKTISLSPNFWIMRNPYLANLWYFLLYFQMLFVFLILKIIKFPLIQAKKWYVGIIIFILSISFSYLLLWKFGKGVTFNVFSWSFLIWIGLLYYSDIKETFENLYNKKSWKFLAINVFSILIIAAVNILGGAFYQDLLSARTHDFILPTLFTQLSFIVILFSITTIISKHSKFLAIFFARVGENSLYIYLLHICIAVIFLRDLGVYGYLLSIPIAIALGYVLNKFFLYIKNLL